MSFSDGALIVPGRSNVVGIVDNGDDVTAVASAAISETSHVNCTAFSRPYIDLCLCLYGYCLLFTRLHINSPEFVVLIMRKQNQFSGLLNFIASLLDL